MVLNRRPSLENLTDPIHACGLRLRELVTFRQVKIENRPMTYTLSKTANLEWSELRCHTSAMQLARASAGRRIPPDGGIHPATFCSHAKGGRIVPNASINRLCSRE